MMVEMILGTMMVDMPVETWGCMMVEMISCDAGVDDGAAA